MATPTKMPHENTRSSEDVTNLRSTHFMVRLMFTSSIRHKIHNFFVFGVCECVLVVVVKISIKFHYGAITAGTEMCI